MTNRSYITDIAVDSLGNALQGAKVYLFAQGTGTTQTEPTAPTGTAVTDSFFAANSGGVALTNPLTTDSHGRWSAYFTTAQRIDAVYSSNNGTATVVATGLAVGATPQYVVPMEVPPPFDALGTPTVTPAGDHDFRVEIGNATHTAKNIRSGSTYGTSTDVGQLVNSIMAYASRGSSVWGPSGSQSLGTPGCSIQILNANTTAGNVNAAATISSSNWIGKPLQSGTDGVTTAGGNALHFTSASANWTTNRIDAVTGASSSDVGRIIYITDGDPRGALHTTIASVVSANEVILTDAAATAAGSNGWTMPITIGMKVFGQGGGTRNQGNGHPDDGGLYLKATGTQAQWDGKAVIDFRNAPAWTSQGFGSEFFEIHHLAVDANSVADYAIVGIGVGTGNASKCHDVTAQGGTVANVGLAGNYFDSSGSSDTFWDYWMTGKPMNPQTLNWNGGALTLPQATITTSATISGLPTNGGFIECYTTDKGRQLVHYTGISGTNFTGCTGGVGTMRNGSNNVRYFAYGANVCQGDVYNIENFNIAVNDHALLITNGGSTGQTFLGHGHLGGGSGGGPIITIVQGKRGNIGKGVYVDNIKGLTFNDGGGSITYSTPGIWIVPLSNGVVSQWDICPSQFNIQEANGYPIGLDAANLGGATQQGWGYQLGGSTNGIAAMANGFVKGLNGWVAGSGVMLDHISAASMVAGVLYNNDAFSTFVPDIIGPDIQLSTSATSAGAVPLPLKTGQGSTANRPAVTVSGQGGLYYNTTLGAFQPSDGTNWRVLQADWLTDNGNTAGGTITPNTKDGTVQKWTKTTTGVFTLAAPSNAVAGNQLYVILKNSTGGAFTVTPNAVYSFPNGIVWPSDTETGFYHFVFDGTNWNLQAMQVNTFFDRGNDGSGTIAIDLQQGYYQKLTRPIGTGTFTVGAPTNALSGQQLVLEIKNSTGGATAGTRFNIAQGWQFPTAAAYPGDTFSKTWTFEFNGTVWINTTQSADY